MNKSETIRKEVIAAIDEQVAENQDLKLDTLIATLVRRFAKDSSYFQRVIEVFVKSGDYVIFRGLDGRSIIAWGGSKVEPEVTSILSARPIARD